MVEKRDKNGIIVEPEPTFESMMELWKQANEFEDVNLDLGFASKNWFFDKLESIKDEILFKKIDAMIHPWKYK